MYLKELIETLEKHDRDKVVVKGFSNPHSYRGYYDQVAFEPEDNTTVGAMLDCAIEANGATYGGWKGGEYTMGDWTEVNLANEGCCGEEIGPTLLSYMLGEI